MQVQQRVHQKITQAFEPSYIELLNESYKHSVPKNSETHFKLTLVSKNFASLSKIKRHQQVYAVLADDLQNPIHALALHLYTEDEWQAIQETSPQSPDCLGGSKLEGKFS